MRGEAPAVLAVSPIKMAEHAGTAVRKGMNEYLWRGGVVSGGCFVDVDVVVVGGVSVVFRDLLDDGDCGADVRGDPGDATHV